MMTDIVPPPSREELDDALMAARQNYDTSVVNTERLAKEVIVTIHRLGIAIARRDETLATLIRLELQRP